jgi:transposase InsO family protein
VHHSHRGVQYVSIRYTERLAEAGIAPSVGSVGDKHLQAQRHVVGCCFSMFRQFRRVATRFEKTATLAATVVRLR